MKKFTALFAVFACAIGAAFAQTEPTIDSIGLTAQTSITENLLKVAGPAFVVMALAIGVGLLMRWLKKAARSS